MKLGPFHVVKWSDITHITLQIKTLTQALAKCILWLFPCSTSWTNHCCQQTEVRWTKRKLTRDVLHVVVSSCGHHQQSPSETKCCFQVFWLKSNTSHGSLSLSRLSLELDWFSRGGWGFNSPGRTTGAEGGGRWGHVTWCVGYSHIQILEQNKNKQVHKGHKLEKLWKFVIKLQWKQMIRFNSRRLAIQ